jgi:hypothetical protein
MPIRFRECVLPFKVLPVIIQMLEGNRNSSIMNLIRENCERHDLLQKRIRDKLARSKYGAMGLVTTLGYRADMSPITQPTFRYCMPLRVKDFVLPFLLLPKILAMLGSSRRGESKIVEQCQRHARLYDRMQTKIAKKRALPSSVAVVDAPSSNAGVTSNRGMPQIAGFSVPTLLGLQGPTQTVAVWEPASSNVDGTSNSGMPQLAQFSVPTQLGLQGPTQTVAVEEPASSNVAVTSNGGVPQIPGFYLNLLNNSRILSQPHAPLGPVHHK